MLTIKHVTELGERVWEAETVSYDIEERSTTVHAELANGGDVSFTGGVVYVMNSAGATVAKYTLSTREMPMGATPVHIAAA